MNAAPDELPVAPAGFHRLAWLGFSLAVPQTWNLTFQRHEHDAGAIGLADLHKLRLEVRWRSGRARRIGREYERLLRRLGRKKVEVRAASTEPPAHYVTSDKRSLLLIRGAGRVYEITWPGKPQHLPEILESFRDFAGAAEWTWQIYGVRAVAPGNLRLKSVSLVPGAARLELGRRSRRVVLGAWSMAGRLLGDKALEEWAAEQIPLVRNNPRGRWREDPPCAEFAVTKRRGLLHRRYRLTLKLLHDAEADAIRWTQTTFPAALSEPPLVMPL